MKDNLQLRIQLEDLPTESLELAFRLIWDPELKEQEWPGDLPPGLESLPPEGWGVLTLVLDSLLELKAQHLLH
jgi:hypothetical protein